MFRKLEKTQYPPAENPLMVWDGECGFCRYWITRWQNFTLDKVNYEPFQKVAQNFADIDYKDFKQASRLIETDGRIFSGPRSAYRTFTYGSRWGFLDRWYENSRFFMNLSDGIYNWVAKNRSFLFRLTKAFFGANPQQVRPFWAIYLVLIVYFIYLLV